jgi:hypothetical protein
MQVVTSFYHGRDAAGRLSHPRCAAGSLSVRGDPHGGVRAHTRTERGRDGSGGQETHGTFISPRSIELRRNRDRTEFCFFPRAARHAKRCKASSRSPHMPIRRTFVPSLPTATKRFFKRHTTEEFLEKPVASCFLSYALRSIAKT